MVNLNIMLTCHGFKKIPYGMKSEEVWRRDKTIILRKRRRFPKPQTLVAIQGSKQSDGTYILGIDDDKLKGAIAKL